MAQITTLLDAARAGTPGAVDRLYEAIYPEMHALAHANLRRNRALTLLDTTGLVHESFLKLSGAGHVNAADRVHFMGYAARVMRSIVVDFVRRRMAERRGGGAPHTGLDHEAVEIADPRDREILGVAEALEELEQVDARLVRVVEMRYFAGLTEAETAEALQISLRTVSRDWEKARLFLERALRS